MNILNDIFRIGGGKNDSLIAAPSTGEVSFKTAYQARHFGHFRFFSFEEGGNGWDGVFVFDFICIYSVIGMQQSAGWKNSLIV